MNNRFPSSEAWQNFRRVYWSLAGALVVLLALLAAMGFGPGGRNCKPISTAAAPGATVVAAGQAAEPLSCRKT